MRILKVLVGAGYGLHMADAIEYQGGVWLVSKWLKDEVTGRMKPERIIRIDTLKHQRSNFAGASIVLSQPLPEDVLSGASTLVGGQQFDVIEAPEIEVQGAPAGTFKH